MRLPALIAIGFLLLSTVSAVAGDAATDSILPPPLPVTVVNPQWGRVGRYAAWENYGVDRFGRWQPRVIYTPDGAFYYYNGQPYPWTTIHPLAYMPRASD
ncbi:MAG TPA: hypothetical protein VMS17_21605 [Gemmataceae bacterium]|nr:hypothetical protein [Gemmataceae bacterium]